MHVGYLYPFRAFPPKGGNHTHAYHLIRELQALGVSIHTLDDPTVAGVVCHGLSPAGTAAFLAAIDLLYVRLDANPLDHSTVEVMQATRAPLVWEINAPANERLAFSWLGGDRSEPLTSSGRRVDHARRWLHAARQQPAIAREERIRSRQARRVRSAICVSDAVGRYAVEGLGLADIEVIPNGTDAILNHPDRAPAELPDRFADHFTVMYAGSPVYPWQGLDVIARAIALHAASPTVPVLFLLLLNQPAGMLPAAENVLVLEGVPNEEVGAFCAAADACITIHKDFFWSRWGAHGSPTKLFDYLGCGRAVIGSDLGQVRDVILGADAGVLFDNTPAGLLEAIRSLAGNRERCRAMGWNGRRAVVERYHWGHVAERTLAVFERALARR